MIILENARVFDGVNPELSSGQTIVIDGGLIKDILPDGKETFAEAEAVDMAGAVVSPGFIDCHLHFLLEEIPDKNRQMNDQSAGGVIFPNADSYVAYRGAAAARTTLHAGITTAFDGGGVNYIDVALRDAIGLGYVEGPDYYISGKNITAWPSHFRGFGEEVSGPWNMRKAVRDRLYWGVNHVKMEMSAPIRSLGRSLEKSSFTLEEILAATDEAHSAGLQVSAHARGARPIIDSINGGIDVICHGTGINDEGIELMLKKGLYLLPTLASPPVKAEPHIVAAKSARVIELLEATGKTQWESVRRAYKAGVKMAMSTDCGGVGIKHGENAKELLRMKEIGMSNIECLRAATSEAAKAVRLDGGRGRIAKGLKADIIAFSGNPLEDLNNVMDVNFVMLSGKVIKNRAYAVKK